MTSSRSRSAFLAVIIALIALSTWPVAEAAPRRYSLRLLEPPERLDYAAPFDMNDRGEIAVLEIRK